MTLREALAKMPPGWAKRRLIEDGPTAPGTDESRMAVVAIAAELRAQGVSEADTLAYVSSRLRLFETGSTHGRALLRQLERSVHFAYHPKDGTAILSGCCRDPRSRTGSLGTGALRATFERYCDEECARVCPILRSIRNPERSLYGTPYEALEQSNLWNYGTKLGEAGRLAFQMIALLALASDSTEVKASRRFLCMKSDGRFSQSAFGRALKRLDELEIVTLLSRGDALRRIEPWSPEWVLELETALGVAGTREAHIREARQGSDGYLNWLHDEMSSRGFEDALADWDPAPETV